LCSELKISEAKLTQTQSRKPLAASSTLEPLTINISQKSRRSLKIFVIIQVIIGLIFCPLLIIEGLDMFQDIAFLGLLAIGGGLFFIYVIVRQIRTAFENESIQVDQKTLTLTRRHLFGSTSEQFLLSDPISILHVGHREYTEHPMANSVVDVTGLAAGEKYVQTLVDDGTLEIRTDKKIVRFGKDVPSWDADKIIERIEQKLGRKLRGK
jgi:hypothetical protein